MATEYLPSNDCSAEPEQLLISSTDSRPALPVGPPDDPLTLDQIRKRLEAMGVPKRGLKYGLRVATNPPSRRVRSGRGNLCSRYPSRKMGRVVQAESLVEMGELLEAEFNVGVVAFWDQPEQIPVTYARMEATGQTYWVTPDFFQMFADSCRFVACKTEEELLCFSAKHPERWVRRPDGRWRFPPGEAAAARLGFGFEVRSSADMRPKYLANVSFVSRYLSSSSTDPEPEVAQRIRDFVTDHAGATILDVLDDGVPADAIYRMIATGNVYVDLERERLADRDTTRVFPDRVRHVLWKSLERPDPYPSFGANGEFGPAALPAPQGDGVPEPIRGIVSLASPVAAAEALKRFELIEPIVVGGKHPRDIASASPGGPSERTLRRWAAAWRKMQQECGRGIVGLLPGFDRRGNREQRLPDKHESLIARFLNDEKTDDERDRSITDLYGEYYGKAEAAGFRPCAYVTFRKRLRDLDPGPRTRKRKGYKQAAAAAPFVYWLEELSPRHGQFPWDIAHIDHTEVDLLIRLRDGKERVIRVWLTVVLCAWSRCVLGFELSFDPPSHASCMMALRDCVRRSGRLPNLIVVDRGPEFESLWFELLCAEHLIIKRSRPKGQPRFGSLIERFFGTTNTNFFHALRGNTKALRNPRAMSREVDPREHVVWNLPMLFGTLETYFFDVYANLLHPALAETPKQAHDRGLLLTGTNAHRAVEFDRDFLIGTLPAAPGSQGARTVQGNGKGIEVLYNLYWQNQFRMPALLGKRLNTRIDPYDVSHVYAWRPDTRVWLDCISNHYELLRGRSWREIKILSKEIVEKARLGQKTPRMTVAIMAPFLSGVRRNEAAEEQRLKDVTREQAGARALTPRLVTQDGVPVRDLPELPSVSRPSEFNIEDWENAPDLTAFA